MPVQCILTIPVPHFSVHVLSKTLCLTMQEKKVKKMQDNVIQ